MINSDDSQQEGSRDVRNLIRIFITFYFILIVGCVIFLCHGGIKIPAGKSGKHSAIAGGNFCGYLHARNVRI
jgi:preprotein translocase subunit SecY